VILILIVLGVSSFNKPVEQGVVKIGISLPLTGPVAILGESSQKAAQMALKDAGITKHEYQLVFEDTQFDPKMAATAASKLINIDKVLAIINFGSGTGNAINAIAEAGETAEFSLASDPTIAKGDYNFIHWTPPFKEGELLAKEAVKRGYKKISIIDANHPGAVAVTDAIKTSLSGTGVEIVSDDRINIGLRDFKTILSKIKQINPDLVVLEMFSPEIELVAEQMKTLGMNIPVTSVEAIEWSNNVSLFEGNWFIADSVVPAFADKYQKEYGAPAMAGSSYVYDLVAMLINIQEGKNELIKPADLPKLITEMGVWKSPVFGNVPIDKDGFFVTEASVKMIKDGKVVAAN
jgi:branched-chain amino acid transport system substrate-binding protein